MSQNSHLWAILSVEKLAITILVTIGHTLTITMYLHVLQRVSVPNFKTVRLSEQRFRRARRKGQNSHFWAILSVEKGPLTILAIIGHTRDQHYALTCTSEGECTKFEVSEIIGKKAILSVENWP